MTCTFFSAQSRIQAEDDGPFAPGNQSIMKVKGEQCKLTSKKRDGWTP